MKNILLTFLSVFFAVNFTFAQATFAPAINYPISYNADYVTTGDFNHDGKTDIVVATNFGNYQLLIYYQDPATGALDTPAVRYNYPTSYPGLQSIASGDLNNDGRDDIAIAYNDSIGIYYQNISGTLNPMVGLACPEGEVAVIKIADVDMDGLNDIVAVPFDMDSDIVVYYGNTTGGFTAISYPTPYAGSGQDDLRVGKIGSDTLNSLIHLSGETLGSPIVQLRIRRDRTLDTIITRSITSIWLVYGVEIGAFSDTTMNQIAVTYGGNRPTSQLAVWRHPDTELVADTNIAVADIPQPMAAGRLGCSPYEQIVILHGGWDEASVVDFAHGINVLHVPCPNNASHNAVAIADVNGDGKPDIVAVNTYAGLSVMLNTTIPTIDTSMIVTHGVVSDSTLASSDTSVAIDTVFVAGGIIVTTDSMIASTFDITTVTTSDSARLILNGCSGDTTGYTSYLHTIDTSTGVHLDTTYIIATDSLINNEVSHLANPSIQIYPNPFTSGITVSMPGRFLVTIYSIINQPVASADGNGKITLRLASIPAGVYFLIVEDEYHNELCRTPIVKQ